MSAAEDLRLENEKLRAEIEALKNEIETIRLASSAGFARGTIKQAPIREWSRRPEAEDML